MKSVYLGGALLVVMIFSSLASAQHSVYLHLREEAEVYSRPTSTSQILGRFRAGARLLISTKDHRGWRRVLFRDRGKKRLGWVHVPSLQDSFVSKNTSLEGKERIKEGTTLYKNAKAFGIAFVPSYAIQKERSLALSDEASIYNISELSGLSMWISLFMDWPMSEEAGLRTYLTYRSLNFKGTSKLNDFGGIGGASEDIQIQQNFLGAGATYKSYFSKRRFWWGGGLEVGRNLSAEVKSAGDTLPVNDEDKPLFFFPHAAFGWDSQNVGRFYFVPDIRIGPVTSFEPSVFNLEVHLGLSYQW